jgi:hypothetical protein
VLEAPLGGWPVFQPCFLPLLLYLCSFTESLALRVWLLVSHLFSGQGQCSTPTSTVSVKLQFAVYAFQFCCESLPRGCTGLCSWGVGRELCMVPDAHLFFLQIHTSSFEANWQGVMAWHREAFHMLGVHDVTDFDSDSMIPLTKSCVMCSFCCCCFCSRGQSHNS